MINLHLPADCDQGQNKLYATKALTNPVAGCLLALNSHEVTVNSEPTDIDFDILVKEISKVATGTDTSNIQKMLAAQAITLQALLTNQMLKGNRSKNPDVAATHYEQALRAQEQCRKTLATLADIKSPKRPTQFIQNYVDKQLNQIRVEQKISSNPSDEKSLEASTNERMDIRAQTTAIGADSPVETVGESDRPQKRRRQKAL
jgi:hypothetical protein